MKSMPVFNPRGIWKAVAVTSTDPVEFAREYENVMNTLVADGWNIAGMIPRGEALVITAQKQNLPPALLQALAALNEKKELPRTDNVLEEVTYNYKEGVQIKALKCASLAEAVGYFQEHIEQDGDILPISIVVMTVTSYEPADLPTLRSLLK